MNRKDRIVHKELNESSAVRIVHAGSCTKIARRAKL